MSSGDGGWGDGGGSADGGPGLPGEEGSTRRSRKRTKQGVYTSDITLDDLARHFHQPASRACQELGMGLTIFKRVCRKLGLQRWPYEKPCREGQQRTPTVQPQGGPLSSDGQQHWALQAAAASQHQQQQDPWQRASFNPLSEQLPGGGLGGWAAPLPAPPAGSAESLLAAAAQVEAALQPGGSRAQKSAAIQHLAEVLVQDAEAAQELLAAIESAIGRQRQPAQQPPPPQQQQQQSQLALPSNWRLLGPAAVQQQQEEQPNQLPPGLLAAAAAQHMGQAQSQGGLGQGSAVSAALQALQWVVQQAPAHVQPAAVQQAPPAPAQQRAVQQAPASSPGLAAPDVSRLIERLLGASAAAAGPRDQTPAQQLHAQPAAVAAPLPAASDARALAGSTAPGNAALAAGLAALLAQVPKTEPAEVAGSGAAASTAVPAPADGLHARSQPPAATQASADTPAEKPGQQGVPPAQEQHAQQLPHQMAGAVGTAGALPPDALALLAAALQHGGAARGGSSAGAPAHAAP